LVACSGGPDSQALLHALHVLAPSHGCRLTAASVDHGLREGAAGDVAIAGQLASSLGLPFLPLHVKVAAGASLQSAARVARYRALNAAATSCGAELVAVGQTLDDQAETVLLRLLRGASIEGLAAIAPRRADGVVRPLIDCARALVHGYVAELGLPVARDPSNVDERHTRVRVRAHLLPALHRENPLLSAHLAHLADDARDAALLLGELVDAALVRASASIYRLREEQTLVRRWALKQLVEQRTNAPLARAHLTALDRMLMRGGQVRVPGDVVVSITHTGELTLEPVAKRGRGSQRPIENTGTK
jgi:tRNA(Ile)-lysidine synthase